MTIPIRGRVAPEGSLDRQRFARMVRSMREARDELEVLVRFEVNGTDDLREALSTMLAFWGLARVTGFWETGLSAEAFRLAYRIMGIE